MNFLNRIKRQLNRNSAYHPGPETSALRDALDSGQRAKRAEDYPRALEALQSAMSLAHTAHDSTAVAVIALNQAEVFIRQRQWDKADDILQKSYKNAHEMGQKTQMAYLLNGQGMLAQAKGDWTSAQQHYEQALETAKAAGAVGAEGRALGLLAETYLHETNASYASHLLREALPKLNLTGDIELSSAFVGQLGLALIASGNDAEGAQLLDRALRLARQMGYRMYERYWSATLGKRASSAGQYNDAYAHLVHVLSLTNPLEPSVETADVLCVLSKVCLTLQENGEALEYAKQALSLSEQFDDPALLARARGTMGTVLLATKQTAEAIPYLEAAANDYLPVSKNEAELSEINILRSLAEAQAETGADDSAIQTYQRAIERAEAKGARLELAQARRDLGLLLTRRGLTADAIREWMAAVTIYEAERQPAQVARLLCDIGSARRFLGQGQRATKDFENALMTLNMLTDDWETRGLVLSNAANMYVDQGDIESAESFFNESIAIARRLNNEAAEATRRGNYGWFLLVTGKPQQAIAALEYALRISRSLRLELQAAIQTDNLGLAYDLLNNYPRALEYHQQALEGAVSLNNAHWANSFRVNQAHTLLTMGQPSTSTPLFETALAGGRSAGDIEVIVRALTGTARTAVYEERPADASAFLDEAVNLARKADMRRALAEALSIYSEQQAALHQLEQSSSLWEEARKLYQMLHSPQARQQPDWLKVSASE
jgi:tetratricopeptide (TPR) repeat protein